MWSRSLSIVVAAIIASLGATACGAFMPAVSLTSGFRVILTPDVNAGRAGWCFIALGVNGGACDGALHHAPVISETWFRSDQPPETVGVAVTTSAVARVDFEDGFSVRTSAERGLPAGLRTVAVRLGGISRPNSSGMPRHFRPLDASGRPLQQPVGETPDDLLAEIPTEKMVAGHGLCTITGVRGLSKLVVHGGSVITTVHRYAGIIGTGFITCASVSVELSGWPMLATVLIDAGRPGVSPPPLPEMRALNKKDVFAAPGPGGMGAAEELYARRIPGGWLVVSRAQPSERLQLLKDLTAKVQV